MTTTTNARPGLTALLRDVALPMGLFYVLRAFDVDALWALVIGGVVPASRVAYVLVRHRRIDPLSASVLAILVVDVAVSLISGDPRLLLARSAWIELLIGSAMLASLVFARRPLIYAAVRTVAPSRVEALERRWVADAVYRRLLRVVTVWWGVGNLLLGGVIVAMAYTLPADSVPVLDTVLTVSLLVAGVNLTRRRLSTAGKQVEEPVAA